MAKREILGTMVCPECGRAGAEIKMQKGGALLYRWCGAGCNAQFFARNPQQEGAMRAAIGGQAAPVTVTDTKGPAAPADPAPGKVELPGKLPPKRGTGNAMLDLINGVA